MQPLKQIYDKKSPLFIVTIAVLIVTIIAKTYPLDYNCSLSPSLALFQLLLIILAGTQVLLKTVVMEIVSKCCSSIRKIHSVVVVGCMLANLALFGLSIFLYLQLQQDPVCLANQPHAYFLQVYIVAYALIYVVLLIVMISVNCDGQTMTVLNQHQSIRGQQAL